MTDEIHTMPAVPPTTETVPPQAPAVPAKAPLPPVPPVIDRTVIHRFREATPASIAKLNADFSLRMDEARFIRLQTRYRTVLHRDPTVGELRLLDAISRTNRYVPAIRSVSTDSPAISETFTDMMEKHQALCRGLGARRDVRAHILPPCTLEDALHLPARYLRRTGRLATSKKTGTYTIADSVMQEAEALLSGFRPVARLLSEGGRNMTVLSRQGEAPREIPARAGDMLVYCTAVPLHALSGLMEHERKKAHPDIGAIRLIRRHSLLHTALSLAPAATLHAGRLIREKEYFTRGFLPITALCEKPKESADTASVDLILRVPAKQATSLTTDWQRAGVHMLAIGQVKTGNKTVITLRDETGQKDMTVVDLPTEWLLDETVLSLHDYTPTTSGDMSAPIRTPAIACLPGMAPSENGLTPAGYELTPLTGTPKTRLYVPTEDLYISVVEAFTARDDRAYATAMSAIHTVAYRVTTGQKVSPASGTLALSVSLVYGKSSSDNGVFAAVCGLYRAAAELGLPIFDPVITDTGEDGIRLTVTAYFKKAPKAAKENSAPAVPLSLPYDASDYQWNSVSKAIYKESHRWILPILRRSYEGSLNALKNALNRTAGTACRIFPVAIDTVVEAISVEPSLLREEPLPTDELPAEALEAAERAEPRTETREIVNPTAAANLAAELLKWQTPLFAMSESDARLLLEAPAVREALDRLLTSGYPMLVLGPACRAFADHGYLPSPLSDLVEIPATGTARITYHGPQSPAEPLLRILRRDLLAPRACTDSLLTLTLSDGTEVPDGFVGHNGLVLGILNGLDAVMADMAVARHFERFYF